MKFLKRLVASALLCGLFVLTSTTHGQSEIGQIMRDPSIDWQNPQDRGRAVQQIRKIEVRNLEKAREVARQRGKPLRVDLPGAGVWELVGIEDGELLYYETRNTNAAISSAANLVHASPYNLDGSSLTVGVWDAGDARNTHQEFGGRVTLKNNVGFDNHATHVSGTIAASGVQANAKGMAFNTLVDSYYWGSDDSEMTAAGAFSPGQAEKITISNHSYGFSRGWRWNGSNYEWLGTGTDQNAYAPHFGQYSFKASSWDSISYNAPYYLIFHSAGNDNNNNPSNGAQVVIGSNTVTYDSTIHPPGDGLYRNTTTNSANGYENTGDQANSKNIMVVGAANDAVTNGVRDPAKSTLSSFSSRGPTDDGRIKPDIVANGVGLTSTLSGSDSQYGSYSGTSMSSPSAAGSAALLVDLYRSLFPGSDMRASTLKGLILHTATDIGNPGPDYHYGWGLIDTKTAADLIIDHQANPEKNRMVEEQLTTAVPSETYTFTWDGQSPIRATLNWTDPAASSTTAHDSRISRLVNDLDLKIIAPDGTEYFPYVMPFVGTWTVESMSAHATTGINSTDNVEQILIENPGQSGQWTVEVAYKGSLTNSLQDYSLLTSGLSAAPLSMAVTRDGSNISKGGADGVSGTAVGSSTQLTYTIANVGGGQLELTTPVTISDQQNCSVSVNTQPTSLINGGDSTNLVATVTPTSGGTWSFSVSIANNDPEKDPYHWLVTGIAGSSGSVTFTPLADTYIDSLNAGSNFGSLTDIRLNNQTGGSPTGRLYMRGLVRFDLSSIPAGTTIESATLDFVQDNAVAGSIDIYEATGTWTEAGATWNNSNTLFGGTIYGTANAPGSTGSVVPTISLNASGLSKIQSWVDTPSGNFGFGITATDSGNSQSWMSLRSREHATSTHHPKLTVTYGSSGTVEAPLMIVSGSDGVLSNGGTDSPANTQEGVGTQLTYQIENLGNANLTLTTPVTATAVSNCSITVNTQPSGTVAASGSTDLVLTVTPTSAGAWSATVSIANNDADKDPYAWTISGSAFGSHTVTYDGNGSESGTAPIDANNPYVQSSTVTVLGNTGDLTKAGFAFAGWNTAANGSGTTYAPGATLTMPGADVTLYAVWNGQPVVDAGPDQSISLSASTWTPLTVNPGLWLDAADVDTITLNGSTVSQWTDKSGFDRHATQGTASNQPTYAATGLNGQGVLTFDGSTDLFSVDLDFLAGVPHSAFIVTHPNMLSNIYGAANASQGANSLHVGFNGSNYRMNYWANDFGPARSANYVAGSANLVNFIWHTGVGKEIMANGKSEGSNTNAGDIGTMSGGGRIGRTTGHPYFGGDIAEIIIIPGTLSAQSRQEVEGYLAHKWGLAANLPNDHPYKSAPPDGAAATTTLAGSASDPENDPLTTQWTLEAGPASADFDDETAVDTAVTFTQEGIYTLRLTGNDEFGSTFDDVTITVGSPILNRTVTYNGNGNTSGEAPVDPQSPYEDAATVTVLDAGTLAKTGHSFAGWNTSADGNGTPYAPDATFTINANITLYAQWIPTPVSVITDVNNVNIPEGGTEIFQVKLSDQPGENVTVTVTRSSGDADITVQSGGSLDFTTANWDTYQTVTLAAAVDADAENSSAIIICEPSDPSLAAAEVTATEMDKDTTLTLTDDGSGTTVPSGALIVEKGAANSIEAIADAGYDFANWSVPAGTATFGDANAASTTVTISEPATVQANFVLKTYIVSYDANAADSGTPPADQTKTHGVDLTLASNTDSLVKETYAFDGWNTATDGSGTDYAEGATYSGNADLTLYANWNSAPTVEAGNPQTVYMTGSDVAWTPADTSTIGWYDASDANNVIVSGTNVTAWKDISGNGYDLDQTPADPKYDGSQINGLNIINFDTTFAEIYRSGIPDINCTEVTLVSVGQSLSLGNFPNYGTLYSADSSDKLHLRRSGTNNRLNGVLTLDGANTAIDNANDAAYATGVPFMSAVYYDGDRLHLRGNGGSNSNSADVANGATFTINKIQSGRDNNTMGHYHGEMIVLNTTDLATLQKVEGYLAHKWGLEAALPADHPYKTEPPMKSVGSATATLAGQVTDADDTPTNTWSDTETGTGTGTVTITNPSVLNSDVTFSDTGTYVLQLTAEDGFQQASDTVTITVELPPLTVSIADAEISEDGGTTTATITRIGTSGDLEVALTSSDTGEAAVPATATILNGSSSVDITITGVPDGIVDGTQTVTITATADNNAEGSATVNVTDVDVITYNVTYDGNGSDGGTVPVDESSPYAADATVTVLGNTGSLAKTDNVFTGWNTAANGSGNSYVASDTFTITQNTSLYAQWSATYTGWTSGLSGTLTDPAPAVDFDNGGVETGLEWVYGGDPTSADDDATIGPVIDHSDPEFVTFTFRRSDDANADPGTSVVVQYGSDLTSWNPAVHDGSVVIFIVTDDFYGPGVDRVEVKINWDLFTDDKAFIQLQVDISP